MASQPNVLGSIYGRPPFEAGPIWDKNGNVNPVWQRWFNGVFTMLNQALNTLTAESITDQLTQKQGITADNVIITALGLLLTLQNPTIRQEPVDYSSLLRSWGPRGDEPKSVPELARIPRSVIPDRDLQSILSTRLSQPIGLRLLNGTFAAMPLAADFADNSIIYYATDTLEFYIVVGGAWVQVYSYFSYDAGSNTVTLQLSANLAGTHAQNVGTGDSPTFVDVTLGAVDVGATLTNLQSQITSLTATVAAQGALLATAGLAGTYTVSGGNVTIPAV